MLRASASEYQATLRGGVALGQGYIAPHYHSPWEQMMPPGLSAAFIFAK